MTNAWQGSTYRRNIFFQIYYVIHLFIWHHIVEKWIVVQNLIRLGVLMSLYSIACYRPAICHCDECVPHPDPCLKKQLDIILLFNNSILILLCIWLFRCVSFWDRLVCVLNFFSASRICDRKCVFNTRMVVFLLLRGSYLRCTLWVGVFGRK